MNRRELFKGLLGAAVIPVVGVEKKEVTLHEEYHLDHIPREGGRARYAAISRETMRILHDKLYFHRTVRLPPPKK